MKRFIKSPLIPRYLLVSLSFVVSTSFFAVSLFNYSSHQLRKAAALKKQKEENRIFLKHKLSFDQLVLASRSGRFSKSHIPDVASLSLLMEQLPAQLGISKFSFSLQKDPFQIIEAVTDSKKAKTRAKTPLKKIKPSSLFYTFRADNAFVSGLVVQFFKINFTAPYSKVSVFFNKISSLQLPLFCRDIQLSATNNNSIRVLIRGYIPIQNRSSASYVPFASAPESNPLLPSSVSFDSPFLKPIYMPGEGMNDPLKAYISYLRTTVRLGESDRVLRAIHFSGELPSALIGSREFRAGDRLGQLLVKKVSLYAVTLEDRFYTLTLSMNGLNTIKSRLQ